MPQPTRGVWFDSGASFITRFRSALSRTRSESQRSESDLRSQKQKKKENRKRGNGKSKMGDGIHGVLATRNPKLLLGLAGILL